MDYYLALEPETPEKEIDTVLRLSSRHTAFQAAAIRPEDRERAELYGYTVIDPLSVMVTHLSEVIKQHAHELLSRQEVVQLVENVKKTAQQLVDEAFPTFITYNLFQGFYQPFKRGNPYPGSEDNSSKLPWRQLPIPGFRLKILTVL